jgi:hypothetical protein
MAGRSQQVPVAAAVVVASLVSALLYGFLQPTFGVDRASLALLLGVALALLLLNGLERVGQVVYLSRAHRVGASLHLFPGFALVALVCVVVSRVTGLQPGLLLGPLVTVRVSQQIERALRGRALFLVFTGVAAVATAAWVTRSDVMDMAAALGSFGAQVVGVTWTTLIVSGVLVVAFNMMPLTFLAGSTVLAWSKPAWAGLAAFGALGFAHLVLRPAAAPGSLARRTTYLLCLLAVYLVVALAFWAWFRFRPPGGAEAKPVSGPRAGVEAVTG